MTEEERERATYAAWCAFKDAPKRNLREEADALAAAINAIAPLIAQAERERCAKVVDCGCPGRETVLNVTNNGRGNTNSAVRWTACGRDQCGALEAAAIRALGDGEVGG